MGNLLRHGVHDGLRGHDGACNCSFGVDGLAGRIRYWISMPIIFVYGFRGWSGPITLKRM